MARKNQNTKSKNIEKTSEKKSFSEMMNDKANRILLGVAIWASFYRENPQRFVKDYLNVTLKLFQKFLIYAMMHNNHFMFWAARSLGKENAQLISNN